MKLLKSYGPEWLGFSRYFPYPLRAARIEFVFSPFSLFWPSFTNYHLTEKQRANGRQLWRARIAFFEISYSRWL
jgi:hypothetical protein